MSRKLNFIPHIDSYNNIREQMRQDLLYRLESRKETTSLGRPLYYRINVQVIMTQECPYNCPFCLERQNPMSGNNKFDKQIESLKMVLDEHPNARLTITGGEPGLYVNQVENLINTYRTHSNNVFCSINTSGFNKDINGLAHINLSQNDYVNNNPDDFPNCTLQTIIENPKLSEIKQYMNTKNANSFSFRFLSSLDRMSYPIDIWNELQEDNNINVSTFRIGDFFVYATFDYNGKHARVTLGDMWQQQHNDYQDGYSNIIIHPDGKIGINWK